MAITRKQYADEHKSLFSRKLGSERNESNS